MQQLYACAACGFLSTRRSEFDRVEGVLFDKDCIEKWRNGLKPVAQWVAENLATAATHRNWHLCPSCAALPRFKRFKKTVLPGAGGRE